MSTTGFEPGHLCFPGVYIVTEIRFIWWPPGWYLIHLSVVSWKNSQIDKYWKSWDNLCWVNFHLNIFAKIVAFLVLIQGEVKCEKNVWSNRSLKIEIQQSVFYIIFYTTFCLLGETDTRCLYFQGGSRSLHNTPVNSVYTPVSPTGKSTGMFFYKNKYGKYGNRRNIRIRTFFYANAVLTLRAWISGISAWWDRYFSPINQKKNSDFPCHLTAT